jgi:S1-C subfamily serine protease
MEETHQTNRPIWLTIVVLACFAFLLGIATAFGIKAISSDALVITEQIAPAPGADQNILFGNVDARELYKKTNQGVVTVRAQTDGIESQGSGAVLTKDGWIITNEHVIVGDPTQGAKKVAQRVFIDFADGKHAQATIYGQDPNSDLALLKVNPKGLDLKPLNVRNSDTVVVGEPVATIGAPFGQEGSLSLGIISSTDRSIASLVQNFTINQALQTDASVNRGNSGGPLLDADGNMIGVNAQIRSESNVNEGVAFAIPSSLMLDLLPRLRQTGVVKYSYLGITSTEVTPQMARALSLPAERGVLVQEIAANSPAASVDLRQAVSKEDFFGLAIGTGGDIITAVNGDKVVNPTELASFITAKPPGTEIEMEIIRFNGEKDKITIKLGSREDAHKTS